MGPSLESKLEQIPKEHRSKWTLDNNGNLVFMNRAYRRQKPPANNWDTKKSHGIQKKRKKINAKSKHNRRSAEA